MSRFWEKEPCFREGEEAGFRSRSKVKDK